jgi:hypothetical protein
MRARLVWVALFVVLPAIGYAQRAAEPGPYCLSRFPLRTGAVCRKAPHGRRRGRYRRVGKPRSLTSHFDNFKLAIGSHRVRQVIRIGDLK